MTFRLQYNLIVHTACQVNKLNLVEVVDNVVVDKSLICIAVSFAAFPESKYERNIGLLSN